ncbi:hypothetical protein KIPB_005339, partial [Kipferlia bialata]
ADIAHLAMLREHLQIGADTTREVAGILSKIDSGMFADEEVTESTEEEDRFGHGRRGSQRDTPHEADTPRPEEILCVQMLSHASASLCMLLSEWVRLGISTLFPVADTDTGMATSPTKGPNRAQTVSPDTQKGQGATSPTRGPVVAQSPARGAAEDGTVPIVQRPVVDRSTFLANCLKSMTYAADTVMDVRKLSIDKRIRSSDLDLDLDERTSTYGNLQPPLPDQWVDACPGTVGASVLLALVRYVHSCAAFDMHQSTIDTGYTQVHVSLTQYIDIEDDKETKRHIMFLRKGLEREHHNRQKERERRLEGEEEEAQ